MRERDAWPSSVPRGSSWLVHQHIGAGHDETIHVLLLHGECGKELGYGRRAGIEGRICSQLPSGL